MTTLYIKYNRMTYGALLPDSASDHFYQKIRSFLHNSGVHVGIDFTMTAYRPVGNNECIIRLKIADTLAEQRQQYVEKVFLMLKLKFGVDDVTVQMVERNDK